MGNLYIATKDEETIRGNFKEISKIVGCSESSVYKIGLLGGTINGWTISIAPNIKIKKVYEVYENGVKVYESDIQRVMDYTETTMGNIMKASNRGSKIHNIYEIRCRKEEIEIPHKRVLSELEIIKMNLKNYGNTVSNKEPSKFIDELKEEGFEITTRYVKPYDGMKGFWVLETCQTY